MSFCFFTLNSFMLRFLVFFHYYDVIFMEFHRNRAFFANMVFISTGFKSENCDFLLFIP